MVIGSHNSWSYLRPKKWWMRLVSPIARCQRESIDWQFVRNDVRCFDLRLRFDDNGHPIVVHGLVEYEYTPEELEADLYRLNVWAGRKIPIYVRVVLDVRTRRQHSCAQNDHFYNYCCLLEMVYPNITFWCGRSLFNWGIVFNFKNIPSCEERYGSVMRPKRIFPYLYAKRHNKAAREKETDKDILLIDFVDL